MTKVGARAQKTEPLRKQLTVGQHIWGVRNGRIGEYVVITVGNRRVEVRPFSHSRPSDDNGRLGAIRLDFEWYDNPNEAYNSGRQYWIHAIQAAKQSLMSFECSAQEKGWVVTD